MCKFSFIFTGFFTRYVIMLCHKEIRSDAMNKNKYPIGFKFNKLTIIDYLENNRCLCKCECGMCSYNRYVTFIPICHQNFRNR